MSDGNRQASAPGTNVRNPVAGMCRGERQRFFYDDLCLWTGDQDVPGDFEVEAPELAAADDLRYWFVVGAACEDGIELGGEASWFGVAAADDQVSAIPAEEVAGEDFSVERRVSRREAGRFELPAGGGQPLGDRRHQAAFSPPVASLSFSEVK